MSSSRVVGAVLGLIACVSGAVLAEDRGWSGRWQGERVVLELAAEGSGWGGRLVVDGVPYRLLAQDSGDGLQGSFQAAGQAFALRARLREDGALELSSEGHVHLLRRVGPDARAAGPAPGTRFAHPAGHLACELPPGWRVQGEEQGVLVIDPAQREGTPREALVLGLCGELEQAELGQPATALVAALGPELERELGALELRFPQGTTEAPREVRVGEAPGAVVVWRGVQGQTPVHVWVGGLLGPGNSWFVLVGIVQDGRQAAYFPGLERLHGSVRLSGPPPAPAPPATDLSGMEFASSSTTPAGSFFSWFEFHAGGRVTRTMSLSGAPRDPVDVHANSDSAGPYTVEGDLVTVRLGNDVEQLRLVREGGEIVALMRGEKRYRRTR